MLASAWLLVREPGGKIPRAIARLDATASELNKRLDELAIYESMDPDACAEMQNRLDALRVKIGHISTLAKRLAGFKDDVDSILDALEVICKAMRVKARPVGGAAAEGEGARGRMLETIPESGDVTG